MGVKNLEAVIQKPLLSEKGALAQQYQNAHTFMVHREATKLQIKDAVQKLLKVKVKSVRTLIAPRKHRRYGRSVGQSALWKKAIVTLAAGETFEMPEGKK